MHISYDLEMLRMRVITLECTAKCGEICSPCSYVCASTTLDKVHEPICSSRLQIVCTVAQPNQQQPPRVPCINSLSSRLFVKILHILCEQYLLYMQALICFSLLCKHKSLGMRLELFLQASSSIIGCVLRMHNTKFFGCEFCSMNRETYSSTWASGSRCQSQTDLDFQSFLHLYLITWYLMATCQMFLFQKSAFPILA